MAANFYSGIGGHHTRDGYLLPTIEAVGTSETSVNFYEATHPNIPEKLRLYWPP
jgi:hypothetical protein